MRSTRRTSRELADIEAITCRGLYPRAGKDFEKPTVEQHLAAIRMLFDWLVTGQVVATNPAHSVRGPKRVVKSGKTTVLTGEQARQLLGFVNVSALVGLRDCALIAVMTFAFARVGAAVAMRVEDYFPEGQALVRCACTKKAASATKCRSDRYHN